ncbi:HlyD family efflux transporter periplasmic adaptor subunit [Kordiimonas sp. SCSIO 12603]|uniref:efflux RND transporter periplasmic adaptor subunit n=1 Tax=Kordiimonas sp. SCSIO 12603 TaxID=2829596 RepID=UPI00210857A8|nr:HlyD family efflux transporter periplasmic adaptor subunit [Kordiimonas sp. SCSIO 12603]UTW58835.1 HlyD family efflux transporter periplasmic adaptor subunit [Kordiimonas sp. SCSIO 12603]
MAGEKQSAEHVSGAGMDRVIRKKNKLKKYIIIVFLGSIVSVFLWHNIQMDGDGRILRVEKSRVVISKVTEGIFEDFIPVRTRVVPLRTVFLDAVEGGRVEHILVEDGVLVGKGELLVELSNTSLQLEATRNEALVTEQLNNLRTIELQLEQNRLSHKRSLADFEYQIKRLNRQAERRRELIVKGTISQRELDETEDELAYNIQLRDLTLESQATDARMQEQQLVYLKDRVAQLEKNLAFAKQNLDALIVKAPVAGKLSGFNIEVGQSIIRGGRLGQIDDPVQYKLTADIDEFYLGRVDIGQTVTFDRGNQIYQLQVSKIYPQVNNGQFEVDMVFSGRQPEGIRRGQTIQTKLTLGDETKAALVPNGAFIHDTGGSWVFVVDQSGTQANRRSVRLGRRNSRFIEVLDGLEVGEKIVTSPYSSYMDMDRLSLD